MSEKLGQSKIKIRQFRSFALSSMFLINVVYFGILCLRLNFFMSSFYAKVIKIIHFLYSCAMLHKIPITFVIDTPLQSLVVRFGAKISWWLWNFSDYDFKICEHFGSNSAIRSRNLRTRCWWTTRPDTVRDSN